jgi:hypothetical protein
MIVSATSGEESSGRYLDLNPNVWALGPLTGLELRRCNAAQFAIVYAYLRPTERFPQGIVSIRAVRHVREKDVFEGVKEQSPPTSNVSGASREAISDARATPPPAQSSAA